MTGGPGQDSYWDLSGPETGVTITLDGIANDGPPGGRSNERCPAESVGCAGAVAVHAKRVRLARKAFTLAPGRALRLRMPLTRRGHRLLRNRTRTRAVARFTAKGGSGVRTARLIVRRAR